MKRVYYNLYDYGRLVGAYTSMDIQTMIHCSRQVPEHCAAEGRAYKGRYTFERIEDHSDTRDRNLAAEWDKERLHILHRFRKGGSE